MEEMMAYLSTIPSIAQIVGSNVVTVGLGAFLGNLWLKRILDKQQQIYKIEFEVMKNEFELQFKYLDNFHKFSSHVFQNSFEEKVSIYKLLLLQSTNYAIIKSSNSDDDNKQEEYRKIFDTIEEASEKYLIYYSESLFLHYLEINNSFKNYRNPEISKIEQQLETFFLIIKQDTEKLKINLKFL